MFVEKGSRKKKSSVRSDMLIYNFKTRALALKDFSSSRAKAQILY